MRIATITNWAYGVTVALTLLSGGAMLLASSADKAERAAVENRARFDEMTASLDEDTYRLTDQARLYSINRNPSHLIVYRREAAELGSVEQRVARLRDAGAQPAELDALKTGLHWADSLRDEQEAAIAATGRGDTNTAREILFGAEYERDLERVDTMIGRFRFLLDQRTGNAMTEATRASRLARSISEAMLAVTFLLFLFVITVVIRQRILRPVVRLSDVVTRLAAQDFAVETPEYSQIDEIGDMAHAIRVFRENGLERLRLERERAADQGMRDLVARMTQRLQGCDSVGGLAEVVGLFAPQIAPALAGRLYVHDAPRQLMRELCNWQGPTHSPPEFAPSACWALRRGQMHRPGGQKIDVPCGHIDAPRLDTICLPLQAQGEMIGLLYFEQRDTSATSPEEEQLYLELLAENVGLALANLRLRDELRQMALVDPLTGLSNRRQLDSVLSIQAAQSERNHEPFACAMLDVDHFKRFNDSFGHDAGDAVLRGVGEILGHAVREDGMAFRYGGEEFLLLMPGFDIARAHDRCEQIQQRIRALQMRHEGAIVGPITASFGLAAYPDHGHADTLVQTADAALLRAKTEGRDRIVVATARDQGAG